MIMMEIVITTFSNHLLFIKDIYKNKRLSFMVFRLQLLKIIVKPVPKYILT